MANPIYYPNGKGDEDLTQDRKRFRKNFEKIKWGSSGKTSSGLVRKTIKKGSRTIVVYEKT